MDTKLIETNMMTCFGYNALDPKWGFFNVLKFNKTVNEFRLLQLYSYCVSICIPKLFIFTLTSENFDDIM